MTRIVFSDDDDLLGVRFARSPAWETHLAVRTFVDERARLFHEPWHRAVRASGGAARPRPAPRYASCDGMGAGLRDTAARRMLPRPLPSSSPRSEPHLLEQVQNELELCLSSSGGSPYRIVLESLVADPAAARELLAVRMQEAWDVLVAPFWPRIEELIDADIGYRSHRLVTRGLRGVLDGLHPAIRWAHGAVEINDSRSADVALAGRGLVLMPSAYAWPVVAAIVDGPWQPTLVYPARGVAELWAIASPPPRALTRLLGQTRAVLLVALQQPASTTALARRLGRSTSGVSGHLLALRDAGLVVPSRHGHEVRYARTRLGAALVRAASAE